MKMRCNIYTILIVFLLIQQMISGCVTTATKGLQQVEFKEDVQKEDLSREDLRKEDLIKKELYREEVDLIGQHLYRDKCSICHELPDIDAYPYTPEDWSSIIDIMHDTKAAKKFITIEETEKIKVYLTWLSQTR